MYAPFVVLLLLMCSLFAEVLVLYVKSLAGLKRRSVPLAVANMVDGWVCGCSAGVGAPGYLILRDRSYMRDASGYSHMVLSLRLLVDWKFWLVRWLLLACCPAFAAPLTAADGFAALLLLQLPVGAVSLS